MSTIIAPIPADPLAALLSPEAQRQAAHTVQETFARVFRLAVGEGAAAEDAELAGIADALRLWLEATPDAEARALRLALLLGGLDQWGLAYTQAFGLVGIPALSRLLGDLRTGLDAAADARFLRQFEAVEAEEFAAQDFKVELRRHLHLALWHAMIAGDSRDDALRVLAQLGGMMLALLRAMPTLGWRLVADALAHIQIQCLDEGLAREGLAQETTQALFESLRQTLPRQDHDRIMAHAARALLAWQRARRAN
ncbi:hypothetical protein B9N43_02660 [Denitratisoma sp. DHT3]|uniref:hypothetical protein n=1 Tax=Denitratisoma sp. DHT3 TaxID=1981880 RepID=UPI0011984064|nr:hypothetical protein [Denitratisoma sp. DHT3]QDX80260.1 hypothetical protein B9N43_02660 [Denitratisoma sp. DHT3]